MEGRLANRTALVTGALGGIGAAIVARFRAEGATVWVADLDPEDGERVQAALPNVGDGLQYLTLDVTCDRAWQAATAIIGTSLDILVNNAGIATTGAIGTVSRTDWQRTMAVNAEGTFLGIQACAPLLAAAGRGDRWASVVNLSSILAAVGMAQSAAYAASKGAVRSLTKAAAVEFAQGGLPIRVNSLHPGFVRTQMTLGGGQEMAGGTDLLGVLAAQTPMKRIARADEIAAGALFLGSDESSFMTGAELTIDGGWTAQ
jgi:NAD(P)-dependent dehydrogenase (short-subunit alcohol dehydrogenase family)